MKRNILLNPVKTYFTFSTGERNGIVILIFVLIIIIGLIYLIPAFIPEKKPQNFVSIQREIDSLFIADSLITGEIGKQPYTARKIVKRQEIKFLKLELNSSDSSVLTKLPGIGPVLSSRIIKYRNLLGGYYNVNQLAEVYGMREENLTKAIMHLTVSATLIKRISPDTANFKVLARHPYIRKEKAWQIINFRNKIRNCISSEDLINNHIFDSVQWQRVKPYFLFQKDITENNK